MLVIDIQKAGLFSEKRKVIQKVLRVLNFLYINKGTVFFNSREGVEGVLEIHFMRLIFLWKTFLRFFNSAGVVLDSIIKVS